VSDNKIIVTGAPAELSDPSSPLTQSPPLFVRPVLCYSAPYVESSSPASTGSLPSDCGPYTIQKDTPTTGGGFSTPNIESDPALTSIPSTTPADDFANPDAVALLPTSTPNNSPLARLLVGPTELTLSSSVATAQVVQGQPGIWNIKVQLGTTAASQWNDLAERYFHRLLAIDMNGQIVSALIIQPTQNTYTPFNELIISEFSQADANAVAAALQSGPLPIPVPVTS
jgi:preprotein translocase subunit SecD